MFSFHQQVQILHWHMWWSAPAATCAGGVFPSSSWRKYSTCTCGSHHPLQLALVVFFPPTTGANTLLALVQLALCGGGCMWLYIYIYTLTRLVLYSVGVCTVWGVYSVGVHTDTPTICTLLDQNNCRLATHTTCNASCTAHTTDTHSGAPPVGLWL